VCGSCAQEFSRKWNLRKHSRSQHGYDPEDSVFHETFGSPSRLSDIGTMSKLPAQTTLSLAQIQQELLEGKYASQIISLYNKTLSGLIHFPKESIQGLSYYVCEHCDYALLTFVQCLYLEPTAEKKHRCISTNLEIIKSIPEPELVYNGIREYKKIELLMRLNQAIRSRDLRFSMRINLKNLTPQKLHNPKMKI
jgi:hypothetical protein